MVPRQLRVPGSVLPAPRRSEVVELDGLRFQVLRVDRRRLYTLLVDLPPPDEDASPSA